MNVNETPCLRIAHKRPEPQSTLCFCHRLPISSNQLLPFVVGSLMACPMYSIYPFSLLHSRDSSCGRGKPYGARAELRHNANRFDHCGTPDPAQPCLLDDRHRGRVCAVHGHILSGRRHRQVIIASYAYHITLKPPD